MKKLITVLGAGMLLLSAGLFTSCDGDTYYTGADMYTETISVEPKNWEWNPVYNRWDAVFDWSEIDSYMYEHGSLVAGVYITETGVDDYGNEFTYESLKSLPFVHSYYDSKNDKFFTRTIGYDISLPPTPPGQITFYMQDSDLNEFQKPGVFDFKVTIFWRQ